MQTRVPVGTYAYLVAALTSTANVPYPGTRVPVPGYPGTVPPCQSSHQYWYPGTGTYLIKSYLELKPATRGTGYLGGMHIFVGSEWEALRFVPDKFLLRTGTRYLILHVPVHL